jgi:hypothetical protein
VIFNQQVVSNVNPTQPWEQKSAMFWCESSETFFEFFTDTTTQEGSAVYLDTITLEKVPDADYNGPPLPQACDDRSPEYSTCANYGSLKNNPDNHHQNFCAMGMVGSVRRRNWGGDAKDNCARTCGYCQAMSTSGVMEAMSPGRFLGIILPVLTLAHLTHP